MSENFSIIQAGHRWINDDGTPTTWFFRLINNMFAAAGGGSPPNLTQVTNNTFSQNARGGTDYARQIADLQTVLAGSPSVAGRIAYLERQVADLQAQLADLRRPPDIAPLRQGLDVLTALTFGVR